MKPVQLDPMIRLYREAFRAHGDSPAAVLWPKDRQALRFGALTRGIETGGFSILDYGCGLAHLHDHLAARFSRFEYSGADAVPEFIAACRVKQPALRFFEIRQPEGLGGPYDYVVLSGVFNVRYTPDAAEHQRLVFDTLRSLWPLARRALAVNFMIDRVDIQQAGACHQGIQEILAFARDEMSPRLLLDHSYMPYEYTLTVFADAKVLHPANVYRGTA
jgi:SAM-dependent methyltransferase